MYSISTSKTKTIAIIVVNLESVLSIDFPLVFPKKVSAPPAIVPESFFDLPDCISTAKIKKIEITFTPAEWIRSVWMHENPKALLKEILDSLREKEEKIKMFSVDIQMSKPDEAYQNAADLIREIRTVLMILRRLQEENQISSDKKIDEKLTVSDYPTAVNEQLKKINCALAENDLIEAGDLFEYEILPLIDALRNSSLGKEI